MKSKIHEHNITNGFGVSKTIKALLLVGAIAFSSVIYASDKPTKDNSSAISQEIGKLLKDPSFTVEDDVFATVKLFFNENNEIVVLTVNSENKDLGAYIKTRLNYKSLANDVNNKNRYYIVPVRITAEQ